MNVSLTNRGETPKIPSQAPFNRVRLEGFSLLEVLIALFVLSIGLVGMAALNLNALKNVHSAQQASLASAIALDFEERLWLRLAETSGGCPDAFEVRDALVNDWRSFDPGVEWGLPLRLPNLAVDDPPMSVTPALGSGGDSRSTVSFRVQWTEDRLLTEGSNTEGAQGLEEAFVFEVEILCRGPL